MWTRLFGDTNDDSTVDIFDALIFAEKYGSTAEDKLWTRAADLNEDDAVGMYDAIILAGNHGKWA